jgi:hypothetical protein
MHKIVGDAIAENAFSKWIKTKPTIYKEARDPVADAMVAALNRFKNDKTFRLGTKGYFVQRGKVCQIFLLRKSPE